jgi:lipoprotein-anchoring transpeptidase ErfK/SrfK
MTSSTDQLIREGHKAIKRGEKTEARHLLEEAAEKNPSDFRAWLGLAAVARTPRESLVFVEKASALAPDNPAVLQARKWVEGLVNKRAESESISEAKTIPFRQPLRQTAVQDEAETLPTAPVQASDEHPAYRLGLTVRRIVGCAAVLGIVIAMGFVAWSAYNTYLDSIGMGKIEETEAKSSPTAEVVALLPEAEVFNILPEEEPTEDEVVENTATPNPIQPKEIIQGDSDPRARWTATPPPTQTPTPSPTWVPTFVSPITQESLLKPIGLLPNERWIDVDLSQQALVAFEGDTPVFETFVSSGMAQYPTVTGQFRIWLRFESQTMDGSRLGYDYYLENVQFVQYFFEDYALHGTYWHNNFGNPMSHGCVNLSNADAEFLYNFADYGTIVNVHE